MACRVNRSTGSRGRLIVQEETCWGQLATPGSQNALGIEFVSESLNNAKPPQESNIIRSDRMKSPAQQGHQRPGGDINGELQPHGPWALLLRHALGGDVATSGSGPFLHSMEGSINLPEGLTLEKRFGFPDGTYKRLRYLGCKVNEFGLTVPTEGIVTCRAGVIAQQEDEVEDDMDASPSYPTDNEPFNSFHGAIRADLDGLGLATIATLTSLDLSINNSIDGEQFAIDGLDYRADAPEDLRIITGNMAAFFTDENWTFYTKFLANTSISLELTLARGDYSWLITIPQLKIQGTPTPQIGGRGPLNIDMSFEAHRDDDLSTDIQVEINNNDPTLTTAV